MGIIEGFIENFLFLILLLNIYKSSSELNKKNYTLFVYFLFVCYISE